MRLFALRGETESQPVTYREPMGLVVILVIFFLINYFTAMLYPIVWLDEVMFTDPAANLYLGHGFHTTAWPNMDKDDFFAGYPPLYSFILSLWMHLTSLSPAGIRSLNYVLMAIAAVVIWVSVVRLRWITTAYRRLALVLIIILGYGVSMSYRSGRPDTLMVLLAATVFLAFTLETAWIRYAVLISFCALFPLAGLQMLPYAAIMSVLLLIYTRKKFIKEVLCIYGGLIIGSIILAAIYFLNGAFDIFLSATSGNASAGLLGLIVFGGEFHHENTLPKDFSFFALFMAGMLLFTSRWKTNPIRWDSPLSFGLVGSLVIPLGIASVGKFPTYYNWMAYIPLAVCIMATLPQTDNTLFIRPLKFLLLVTCMIGLPFQLAFAAYDWEDRRYEPVALNVETHVTKDDWVLTDYGAYYAVKIKAAKVFALHYLKTLSADERQRITVLIIDPDYFTKLQTVVGGEWHPVGQEIKPQKRMLTEDLLNVSARFGIFDRKYHLQIYRRDAPPLRTTTIP